MAKRGVISKHSRAARRGEIDKFESAEAKELKQEPRLQSTDTVSPLIRASLEKNQQLLSEKAQTRAQKKKDIVAKMRQMTAGSIGGKKATNMVSKTIKTKQRKFLSVDGRLGAKIEASVKRNRIVANLRKTGWEKINQLAKNSLNDELISKMDSVKKDNLDIEEEIAKENNMEVDDAEEESVSAKFEIVEKPNIFALLEEE